MTWTTTDGKHFPLILHNDPYSARIHQLRDRKVVVSYSWSVHQRQADGSYALVRDGECSTETAARKACERTVAEAHATKAASMLTRFYGQIVKTDVGVVVR